ncbi:thioredoxin family protein [Novosphingobium sp.]|uniref:thioredoxin family protein n=1 Tax=Novosphingobium sp. TaxID=1874826 RepID=UPI002734D547|nr:thioredoxin family protein [Novosphingobium sp.]MDP3906960.1 thioredoxin family protein [Novosphingobium sp.]
MLRWLAPALLLALALPGGAALAAPAEAEQPAYYPAAADARADLDAALADAARDGRSAVIVFGADWCHDSTGLAKLLTSPAFRDPFGARFSVTFIDVGVPQVGKGRNLDLAARYGVKRMRGTPIMFVIGPDGRPRNSRRDAQSWRNADSRGEAAILEWFRRLSEPQD